MLLSAVFETNPTSGANFLLFGWTHQGHGD